MRYLGWLHRSGLERSDQSEDVRRKPNTAFVRLKPDTVGPLKPDTVCPAEAGHYRHRPRGPTVCCPASV